MAWAASWAAIRRRTGQQAVEQQHLDESRLLQCDSIGCEWVEIERPDLDVFDPCSRKCCDQPRRLGLGLRSDRAVILVLELQQIRIQLPVGAIDEHTDGLIARLPGRQRLRQLAEVNIE